MECVNIDLHGHLSIGVDVVGVAALLAPAALDNVPGHLRVVSGHDGVSCRLLGGKSEIKAAIKMWRNTERKEGISLMTYGALPFVSFR